MAASGRIGILTFHRCINYGSYWQARCLVEGLRQRGHDAVLLDHQSCHINRAEWRCALRPIPDAPPPSHTAAYAAKTRKFFAAFEELPLSKPFPLDAPEQSEPCDLVLVGSDEVWNISHPWYGAQSIFYGSGFPKSRLASYAASFGNQKFAGGLDQYWSDLLSRFDAISVRDSNSQAIVASATGRMPPLVLDPCLQFAHLIPQTTYARGTGPYAVVYGHSFPAWLSRAVQRWARAQEVHLISVGYNNPWADDQIINAGPMDFPALIAGASAVVTNFFHGCVFALVFGKPFVTAPTMYRLNKVSDLMTTVGAQSHMVSEGTADKHYDRMLATSLDPKIADKIAMLRVSSTAYLDHVLS